MTRNCNTYGQVARLVLSQSWWNSLIGPSFWLFAKAIFFEFCPSKSLLICYYLSRLFWDLRNKSEAFISRFASNPTLHHSDIFAFLYCPQLCLSFCYSSQIDPTSSFQPECFKLSCLDSLPPAVPEVCALKLALILRRLFLSNLNWNIFPSL